MATLALVATYLILRFASSPIDTAIVVVAIILLALAVLGYLGAGRGHAAPFVAVALVLPYLLGGVAAYASANRVTAEIGDVFDSTTSTSQGTDTGTDTGTAGDTGATDHQGDAVEGGHPTVGDEAPKIDGGTYTWSNGITLTMKVTHNQSYGSRDDFCGDGSCGIANPDDLTWVVHYQVSVPKSYAKPLDPSQCPGDLHVLNGNDDKSFGAVEGDFSSEPGGKIMPGTTKSGDAEYYIEKKALGKAFYMESYCGDPDSMEESAYFEQTINSSTSTDSASKDLGGPCIDLEQYSRVNVGMTQAEVTRMFNLVGRSAGGGAGGFTLQYPDCAASDSPFYVTFDSSQRPYRVAEKRHPNAQR